MTKQLIKILIVEDELIIGAKIAMHLRQMGYQVTGTLAKGEDVIPHCQQYQPDILLLDVYLKGSWDGIQTAKELQKVKNTPIIYLTANADNATFERAKTTHPFAFISKPYKRMDLQRTIELVVSQLKAKDQEVASVPAPNLPSFVLEDRIFIRQKEKMVKVYLQDICYVEADRSYCRIFTSTDEHLLSIPLKNLEQKLKATYFMRIHRSYIVNLRQLDEITENSIVVGQKAIPIGKSYKDIFIQRIQLI